MEEFLLHDASDLGHRCQSNLSRSAFSARLIGGWLIGLLLLGLYITATPEASLRIQPLARQIAIPATIILLLLLLYRADEALDTMATLLGLVIGIPLEQAKVRFRVSGSTPIKMLIRFILGLLVMILIWRFQPLEVLGALGSFIRYSLLGLWVSLGAPWLFVQTSLAEHESIIIKA